MIENVLLGLGDVFNVTSLLFMFFGVVSGIIVGAIPGLSGPIAIALCIPFTYYMSPVAAIGFLVGINKGGTFGGSIASILLTRPVLRNRPPPVTTATPWPSRARAKKP